MILKNANHLILIKKEKFNKQNKESKNHNISNNETFSSSCFNLDTTLK